LKDCSRRFFRRPAALMAAVVLVCPAAALGQSVSVSAVADALHVRAPGFSVIKGETMNRLKNGRTVRLELELLVLPGPGAPPAVQARQTCVLSYDLWEERFAVTQTGPPPRSISHLQPADADAWCLDRLTVPVSALGRLARDEPFWIRLEYRVQDEERRASQGEAAGYSLRGLIDMLSRRRRAELRDSIEAGPFRLPK
jgi:hypothetical protein